MACYLASAAATQPSTTLSDGSIINGFYVKNTDAYRGIPYAAPPTGDNRFRPPQPASSWNTPLAATKYGASCLQMGSPPKNNVSGLTPAWNTLNLTESSEDCLYLNVYTPTTITATTQKKSATTLPIMVYLHAGEFRFGTSNDLESGNSLNFGKVILITANVRLGYFGFAALDQYRTRDPSNSTGNYGLQDQRAVLQWVQKNGASFGGDTTKVTIFGESSGGSSVGFHVTNPKSNTLFARAIMESPGLTQSHSWYQSETNTQYLLSSLTAGKSPHCAWPTSSSNGIDPEEWRTLPGVGVYAQGSEKGTSYATLEEAQNVCMQNTTCLLVSKKPNFFHTKSTYILINVPSTAGTFNVGNPLFFLNVTKNEGSTTGADYGISFRLSNPSNAVQCGLSAAASDLVAINLGTPFADTFITDATAPTVDGVELKQPLDKVVQDASKFVPGMDLLSGANLDEGTEFMSVASPIPCDANDNDLLTWSNSMFGPILGPLVPTMYTNDSLIQPIPLCQSRHHSSSKLLSKSTPTSWQWQAAMRSAGDSAILCRAKAMLMVNATSSSKNNRWLYYFTHTPAVSLNMGDLKYYGAFHGAEVPFVFGFLKEVTTPEEVKLSQAMGCYWTNFAETGNPNTGDCVNELKLIKWPRLNENGNVLEFVGSENQTAVAVNGLKEKICTTFAKFY